MHSSVNDGPREALRRQVARAVTALRLGDLDGLQIGNGWTVDDAT